jgi:hypothetical protein
VALSLSCVADLPARRVADCETHRRFIGHPSSLFKMTNYTPLGSSYCMQDCRRDTDGTDLWIFSQDFGLEDCSGDFPGDLNGGVDDPDMGLFAAESGRNDGR